MKKAKYLSLIVASLLIVCMLVGCSGGGTGNDQTTASQGSTSASASQPDTSATSTEPAETTAATLPTFDGYEFWIVGEKGGDGDTWYVQTAQNALQNKLLQQYEKIEDALDITINFNTSIGLDQVITYALGNESAGDFLCFRHNRWVPLAVNNYILPLNSQQFVENGLDVTDENQVDKFFTGMSTFLDGENVWAFSCSGDYYVSNFGHSLAFNKRLLEGAGYKSADLYQMVRDHKWTWSVFEEMCRAISIDDGQTLIDGYSQLTNDTVEITSNCPINYRDTDGKWKTSATRAEFITAAEWVIKIWNDHDVTQTIDYEIGNSDRRQHFYDGNMGFMVLWAGDFGYDSGKCNQKMADDYGFVPFPMGPNATEYSHIIPDLYGWSCMTANKDVAKSAYIMGQIAWALNNPDSYGPTIRPYFRDDESVEMVLEYMLPNATPNTARLSDDTRQVVKGMYKQILGSTSAAAICEQFANTMQATINDLFKY